MSSTLKSDIMRSMCEDEWIAKTYSEYLLSCAETKIEFVDAVQDASVDEQLEQIIDIWSDYISDSKQDLRFALSPWLTRETYPNLDIQWTDPTFKNAYLAYVNTEDGLLWWNDFSTGITLPDLSSYVGNNDAEKFLDYMQSHNEDDIIANQTDFQVRLGFLAGQYINNHDFNNTTLFTLDDCCVNLRDLFNTVVKLTALAPKGDMIKLEATNFSGQAITMTEMGLEEFWNQTKRNLGSTIAWAEGFATSTKTDVVEAVTDFSEKIKGYFNDISSYINQSVNTVKQVLISTKGNVTEFMLTAGHLLGWDKLGQEFETVNETDMSQYTGASPLSDINLKTAKGIAQATMNTIIAAGCAIWQGLVTGANKFFKKIRPTIRNLTPNPYDIGIADQKAESYTFDTFSATFKNPVRQTSIPSTYDGSLVFKFANETKMMAAYRDVVRQTNKWIAYQTLGCEVLFRVSACIPNLEGSDTITVYYDYEYKPRLMDATQLLNYNVCKVHHVSTPDPGSGYPYAGYWISGNESNFVTDQDITDYANNWTKLSHECYRMADDQGEGQLFFSLAATNVANRASLVKVLYEIAKCNPSNDFPTLIGGHRTNGVRFVPQTLMQLAKYSYGTIVGDGSFHNAPSVYIPENYFPGYMHLENGKWVWGDPLYDPQSVGITNLDVLKACCGWDPSAEAFNKLYACKCFAENDNNNSNFYIDDIISSLMILFVYQRIDKRLNPESYLYLPFSSDTYTFMEPHYRVITSVEQANVAQALVNIALVVIVITITVVVGAGIFKIFKARKFARLNRKKGEIDNAYWQGQKLPNGQDPSSMKNVLKYQRLSKKVDKLNSQTSGLSTGNSMYDTIQKVATSTENYMSKNNYANVNTNNNVLNNAEYIIELIRGPQIS